MNIREPWHSLSERKVTCIACGETLSRSDAREYDKYGDRWNREGKEFEYLCKACHRECCHQNRDRLEAVLIEAGAGQTEQKRFLRRYCAIVRSESATEY